VAALFFSCCTRPHHVVEQLEWSDEAMPYPFRPLPLGAVRFTFVSAPNAHVVVSDVPWLADRLRASGTSTATIDFDVYCKWSGGVSWFSVRAVNGIPIPGRAGGWMESTQVLHDLGPFPGACR